MKRWQVTSVNEPESVALAGTNTLGSRPLCKRGSNRVSKVYNGPTATPASALASPFGPEVHM